MNNIVSDIANAVFKISHSEGSGTGFYLNDKKILVTNYHVVGGFRQVSVEDQKLNRYLADVIVADQDNDMAFLKVRADFNLPQIEFSPAGQLKSSDQVYVLGYPYGMPYTVTEGIVSAPNQLMDGRYYVQTDAAVNPGNSGGAVVDSTGKLVGITTAKFTEADNMGFAIPVEKLREELSLLEQNPENKYAIKCSSCGALMTEQVEYCNNCGNQIDLKLWDEPILTNFGIFVEEALKMGGINPILTRTGYEFWSFYQGSSLLRIFVYDKSFMYATSPLNALPNTNLEALYKYLASNPIPPYQLGVYENTIYISYRRHMTDLFTPEKDKIKQELSAFPVKADEMDDFFVKEFGCKYSNFSKTN
jgi:serine protease Do